METVRIIRVVLGYRDNGKENGNCRDYRGYKGIMEKNIETIGIKKGCILLWDNGKANGNCRDCRSYIELYRGSIGIGKPLNKIEGMEKNIETTIMGLRTRV